MVRKGGIGDPGIDQPVGRAKETGLEARRFADAPIRRRELAKTREVRVVEGVVSDLVAVEEDFPHQLFAADHVFALLEEGGAGVEANEDFEDGRRLGRARAVVEGECDLPGRSGSFRDDAAGARGAPHRFAAQSGGGPTVRAARCPGGGRRSDPEEDEAQERQDGQQRSSYGPYSQMIATSQQPSKC